MPAEEALRSERLVKMLRGVEHHVHGAVHGAVDHAYLVDDKPEVTGSRTPTWRHVVFDQPYNRGVAGLRMNWSTWREVLCASEQHPAGDAR